MATNSLSSVRLRLCVKFDGSTVPLSVHGFASVSGCHTGSASFRKITPLGNQVGFAIPLNSFEIIDRVNDAILTLKKKFLYEAVEKKSNIWNFTSLLESLYSVVSLRLSGSSK